MNTGGDTSGLCPIGREKDRAFLRFCADATDAMLSGAYRYELELGDDGEEWRLIALERALDRGAPDLALPTLA